jgi:uncharacterized protein
MTQFDAQRIENSVEYQQELAAQRTFMARVYGWMTIGLFVTALIALGLNVLFQERIFAMGAGPFYILLFVQFGIALAMGFLVNKMPAPVAAGLFLLYSAITGVVFSILFLVYTKGSIAGTFFITAGMFGATSAWGYVTKKDLSSWGSMLFMALIGLVIASIVNIFLRSSAMMWLCSVAGVVIFTALTAYDTQKIKQSYADGGEYGSSGFERTAVFGAFHLYLDFINLFIYLLRLLGSRRD